MARVPRRPVPRLALSISDAAMSIGVSPSSFQQMVDEGKMPPARLWHSRKLYLVSEIEIALYDLPTTEVSDYSLLPIEPAYEPRTKTATNAAGNSSNAEMTFEKYRLMSEEERNEYDKKQLAEWAAKVPGSPYYKVEVSVLRQLNGFEVGMPINWHNIKGLGWATQDRLKARGFIEFIEIEGEKPFKRKVCLTETGWEAVKKVSESSGV